MHIGIKGFGYVNRMTVNPQVHKNILRQFFRIHLRFYIPGNKVFDFIEISKKYFLKSSMAIIPQRFYRLFSNWLHGNKGIAKTRNIRNGMKKSLRDVFTKSSRRLLKSSRRLFQTIEKTFLFHREDFFLP
jgi:hypothetical protein